MSGRMPDRERDAIDEQASRWLVRLGEGALSSEEEDRFRRWRAADVRHEETFVAMQRTWGDIGQLGDLGNLVAIPPAAASPLSRERSRRRPRFALAAVGSAAAAAVLLFVVPHGRPGADRRYATELAETRRVTLPDGSLVTLGARSAIDVDFAHGERRVTLSGGEAFFEVVHDAAHPFLVLAGPSTVRDVGTKFNVNLGDGSVRVSVLEGLVQVSRPDAGSGNAPSQLLHAGQRAEVKLAALDDEAAGDPAMGIVTSDAQSPGAWREGRLVYDNVRLADLVADVNRYYAPGVSLDTRAVGDLRVTASFKPGEIPAFMDALGATLPVDAIESQNGAFRIAPISG